MADESLLDIANHVSTPTTDARFYLVDDVSGTPVDGYIEFSEMRSTLTSASSSSLTQLSTGQTETLIDSVTSVGSGAIVYLSFQLSANDPGNPKGATVRLRRGLTGSGTILQSFTFGTAAPFGSDSISGNSISQSYGAPDIAYTTGEYCWTTEMTTGTGGSALWSAGWQLSVLSV